MSLIRIAARISAGLTQPLSERPDYGTREMVSQEQETHINDTQEQQGIIKKTPGKGYCVKSEKNPDWSGGCYPTKGKAENRLKDVEMFKHMSTSLDDATESISKTVAQQEELTAGLVYKSKYHTQVIEWAKQAKQILSKLEENYGEDTTRYEYLSQDEKDTIRSAKDLLLDIKQHHIDDDSE